MIPELTRHTRIFDIVGDLIRVKASDVALGELAEVENVTGETSTARVIALNRDLASLQLFTGGKGLSTDARVRFLGHGLQVTYSDSILGRIFRGSGEPVDSGPDLSLEHKIPTGGLVQLPGRKPEDPDLFGRRRTLQSVARADWLSSRRRCGRLRRHGTDLR
jgi:V/A-type H+-transporting ATPase subunit B